MPYMAFQSTPSAWRETKRSTRQLYHVFVFQSTPSAWRETVCRRCRCRGIRNFNPLPPHGGRPIAKYRSHVLTDISIHSLRMEGDGIRVKDTSTSTNFNPLPPHGGRLILSCVNMQVPKFQSTPSAWRETRQQKPPENSTIISIHSLRMEGDQSIRRSCWTIWTFQSTPSAWRETLSSVPVYRLQGFQSTPSAWRETKKHLKVLDVLHISIHSLRMEGDRIV